MSSTATSKEAGFSLVETMVTVAIVGLMAAAVSLTMLSRPDPVRLEAERLYARFEEASETAMLSGEIIGFAPEAGGTGYLFLDYRDGAWRTLTGHPALAPCDLPEGVYLFAGSGGQAGEEARAPLIWFDPTGFDQPFDLLLQGPGREVRLVRGGDGALSIRPVGGPR